MYEGLREMKSCFKLLSVRAIKFGDIDECMRG